MTIASNVSKVTLNGNGASVNFPFTFKVWKDTDLEVSLTDPEGVVSVTTNWTVTLSDEGGTVRYPTTGAALPAGWKITIRRDMDFLQSVDLVPGTQWNSQVVEDALDIATAERQQLKEEVDRAIKLAASSVQTPDGLLEEIFIARDTAVSSADASANSAQQAADAASVAAEDVRADLSDLVDQANAAAQQAEIAANSVGVLSTQGTLLAGQDTINLPWQYTPETGNVAVYLSGIKQSKDTLTFVNNTTIKIGAPVTADTPFEVVGVLLSGESILTDLRDEAEAAAATAVSAANTAVAAAEIAQGAITPITATSGTQVLEANKRYSMTVTGNTTFTLPLPGTLDATKKNTIEVHLYVTAAAPTITFGAAYSFNLVPVSADVDYYSVYYEYNPLIPGWVYGVLQEKEI